ncbi:MAG: DNA repair protein RecO [Gemmatimonadetes bacterium]|jgi:DNA repair protein RecO (recombination protein O)|nr:DNA repair protein RecO [Gemmatimonadota bacterium]MBT5058376.1 DNA repair protein RecO [Gemmatimonadota bacterium]MBT5146911.1 DNA repair protein RecO [Gemmatimonadota bacterium]MBT5591186.1 DNA repair protein RecO [Gemmatimonadota bacterium]MBT5960127.1 DNA repair protein RecO [Gemmatimonadota bacterium]
MARVIVKTAAVVLRTFRMGETSKLVTLYSENHGKLKVMAKGARKPKSKYGGCLEVTNEIQIVCYLRDDRDLQTLSDAEVVRTHPQLLTDLTRLAYAGAASEMLDRLTIEHEANERLYACLTGVLAGLEEVAPAQLESLFWYFQLRVAAALGYRPELVACTSCGGELTPQACWFSPALGGGVCHSCSREAIATAADVNEGGGTTIFGTSTRRVSGESLQFLAVLQAMRTYSRDELPAAPARSGEIRNMLRGFLEYHAGASGRLRSLEFLDALGPYQPPHNTATANDKD